MKNAWILACMVLLVSVPAFAETPAKAPLSREAIAAMLGLSAGTGSCGKAAAPSQVRFAAQKPGKPGPGGGVSEMATCSVTCDSSTTLQCTTDISCQSFERNCTTDCEPGHITCVDTTGTTTQTCPTACSAGFCCSCEQTGSCYDCCRCGGGTQVQCNNCCTCEATSDCFACCRCEGHGLAYCNSLCFNP
jgi:hypothetical protein